MPQLFASYLAVHQAVPGPAGASDQAFCACVNTDPDVCVRLDNHLPKPFTSITSVHFMAIWEADQAAWSRWAGGALGKKGEELPSKWGILNLET